MLDKLKELGLSHYESLAFTELLSERLTFKQISRKAKIPAGKVYSVVNSLHSRGLISLSENRPKQAFVHNASETVRKLIKQKQVEHEALITTLRTYATEIDASKAQPTKFFQLGTTLDDNKSIQSRTFIEAEREVCQIINIHHKPHSNRKSKTIWEQEIEKAVGRGVRFRSIYPIDCKLPNSLAELNKKHPALFAVKRLDTDFCRCDIIDGKKTLIKLIHQDATHHGGVIFVENERFASNLQELFEQFWQNVR
ncbi:hypothetical protein J4219_05825 [Candidatus Woesearchaeota archaeon]|nr:hypothetical protein [Candidatus Woesearchaeota archaeon]